MTDRLCVCGEPLPDTRTICTRCTTQLSHHLGDQQSHRQELITALTRQIRMNAPNDAGRGNNLALDWKRMGERYLDTITPQEMRKLAATLPPARPAADALARQRDLLMAWCSLAVDIGCGTPQKLTIQTMSLHLEANLHRLHTHPAAGELVTEVRDLVKQILKVIDVPANRMRITVGPCPEDDDTGDPCVGEVIAVVPHDETVPPMMRCQACKTEYAAEQWTRAGARILRRQGKPATHPEGATNLLRAITPTP